MRTALLLALLTCAATGAAAKERGVVWSDPQGRYEVIRTRHENGWFPNELLTDVDPADGYLLIGVNLPDSLCIAHIGGELLLEFAEGDRIRTCVDNGILVHEGKTGVMKDSRWKRITITPEDDHPRAKGYMRILVRISRWRGCERWALRRVQPSWEVKKCDNL